MEITSKDLYKARPQIMGLAALLILIVHMITGNESFLTISLLKFGHIGVDIFLFLSGIGCYQSLTKRTISSFYWQRAKRVLFSYLIIFIGYGAFQQSYEGISISAYWHKYSMLLFPVEAITWHWFVFGILFLYLITPLLHKIVGSFSFWVILIVLIFGSSQMYFYSDVIPHNIYIFNELFITRIPVYMLGLSYGSKLIKNDRIIVDNLYIKLFGMILIIFFNNYYNKVNTMGILHFLSIPTAIYATVFLTVVFNKVKIIPLEWIGKSSLETYLLDEKVMEILATYTSFSLLEKNMYTVIITIVGAIILKSFINLLTKGKFEL